MSNVPEPLVEELSRDLPREVAPGVTWIGACLEFRIGDTLVVHGHTSTYLVVGPEAAILVDTGNPSSWAAIQRVLDDVLGDRPLDYVFPTHPELPHTGNLPRLVAKYPGIRIVGDVRDYHLFYPGCVEHLDPLEPGARVGLGGDVEFVVVEAMIRDLPNTQWGYVPSAKTLFTADGFCYMHRPELDDEDPMHLPGECGLTTAELASPPTAENASYFTGSALYWSRFIDDAPERYASVLALIDELGAEIVAPTHGNVITDVRAVLPIVQAGHQQAYRYGDAAEDPTDRDTNPPAASGKERPS